MQIFFAFCQAVFDGCTLVELGHRFPVAFFSDIVHPLVVCAGGMSNELMSFEFYQNSFLRVLY